MAVERRGPAVGSDSNKKEGKGGMTKTPISLQDLRRSLYVKAKAEPTWRFWGLYVHVCKDGNAPGSLLDGEEVMTELRESTGSRLKPLRRAEGKVF